MKALTTILVAAVLTGTLCPGLWAPETYVGSGRIVMMHQRANTPRVFHTQTVLSDGKVLLAGGFSTIDGLLPLGSKEIELFDPEMGSFDVVTTMPTIRAMHTATQLSDGRVLFIGGTSSTLVEVFDPETRKVAEAGHLNTARAEHAATLLPDGTVLITGGVEAYLRYSDGKFARKFKVIRVTEIFDPATGKSTVLDTYTINAKGERVATDIARRGHTQTLLTDGTILIVGGDWGRCLFLDPKTGLISQAGRLPSPREDHRTTVLKDGRLLITGGTSDKQSLDNAIIYDPVAKTFTEVPSTMSANREDHTATLLDDGRVLITGGENNQAGPNESDVVLSAADIYDPETNTFFQLKGLNVARDDHRASLLKNGKVFIFGGLSDTDEVQDTGELFTP